MSASSNANRKYLAELQMQLEGVTKAVLKREALKVLNALIMNTWHDTSNAAANWTFYLNNRGGNAGFQWKYGKQGVAAKYGSQLRKLNFGRDRKQNAGIGDRYRSRQMKLGLISNIATLKKRELSSRIDRAKHFYAIRFHNPLAIKRYAANANFAHAIERAEEEFNSQGGRISITSAATVE